MSGRDNIAHAAIGIPECTREAWQKTADIMADIVGVPAALIMRIRDLRELEVFVASDSEGNPFTRGEVSRCGRGCLCDEAMRSGSIPRIPNAPADPTWKGAEPVERDVVSCPGLPLLWPDGQPFGSICIMDMRENHYSARYERLLTQFQEIINLHLALLFQQHELKERTRRIEDALLVVERIRVLVENRTVEHGDHVIDVTLGIGISCLEGAGESLDDLVAKADRALYSAKESGRNRIEVYERLAGTAS